jgi:hypothetical protein
MYKISINVYRFINVIWNKTINIILGISEYDKHSE